MGGNALSKPSVRLHAAVYHPLAKKIEKTLSEAFGTRCDVIPAYSDKESFGDLDILIEHNGKIDKKTIGTHLGATELVKNGDVISYGIDVGGELFQVDVILCKAENYLASLHYFSYNDLGNLLGRIAKTFGLKLGFKGLKYVFRESDQQIKEITITTDWNVVLDLFGLSKETYHNGFKTLEDIFQFVASSPYFFPDIYLFENVNAVSRIRDKKRSTYNAFLKWCDDRKAHFESFAPARKEQKTYWRDHPDACLELLFEKFPSFKCEYAQAIKDVQRLREIRNKFNGRILKEWTGLEGAQLGEAIQRIIKTFKSQELFHNWVEKSTTEQIQRYCICCLR